jgi:hypothetical protein
MGLFESFGAGLSAIQEQDKERNAVTQQLLTQLIAQNPALAETPEIQAALKEAFPGEQYAGIAETYGAVNQARLGEESRVAGVVKGVSDQGLLDQILNTGAGAGIPIGADNLAGARGELSAGVAGKTATSRSQELLDAIEEHKRKLELAQIKAMGQGSTGRYVAGAIGDLGVGIMGLLKDSEKITEKPSPGVGAENAAQLDQDLVLSQLQPRYLALAQITHLHDSLMQSNASPGVPSLWREFNGNPEQFSRDYAVDWENAKGVVAVNEARNEGQLMATIGGNAETQAIMDGMRTEAQRYLQSKAEERLVSIPNEAAFTVAGRVAEAGGAPNPFPPADTGGDTLYPGQGDTVYTQPEITFQDLPPAVQEMYLEGEGISGLNAIYSTILQVHGLDYETAIIDMRDMREQFAIAGYLEPVYGGQ